MSAAPQAKAIAGTYTADVVFYEPDAVIEGHEPLSNRLQTLLDKQRPGWVF